MSYTAEELRAMRARGEVHEPDLAYFDSLAAEELEASIDIEGNFPIWETAVEGNPGPKQRYTVRFDQDVVVWFKTQGPLAIRHG